MTTATVDNMTTGIDPETLDALEQRVLSAWPESSALAPEEVQTCNWDEFNWPCDTAIVLDALDAAIARAEAAERVVEAARSPFDGAQWRRWLNERSAMGKQWRRRDRLMEAVLDYDAARTPAESESTP